MLETQDIKDLARTIFRKDGELKYKGHVLSVWSDGRKIAVKEEDEGYLLLPELFKNLENLGRWTERFARGLAVRAETSLKTLEGEENALTGLGFVKAVQDRHVPRKWYLPLSFKGESAYFLRFNFSSTFEVWHELSFGRLPLKEWGKLKDGLLFHEVTIMEQQSRSSEEGIMKSAARFVKKYRESIQEEAFQNHSDEFLAGLPEWLRLELVEL